MVLVVSSPVVRVGCATSPLERLSCSDVDDMAAMEILGDFGEVLYVSDGEAGLSVRAPRRAGVVDGNRFGVAATE